jgi:hypothetical protein
MRQIKFKRTKPLDLVKGTVSRELKEAVGGTDVQICMWRGEAGGLIFS